jgi:hypothetical protein
MNKLSSSRAQGVCIAVVLLATGPILIAIHPSIPFLNDGNCDPWFLFGTFYHFPEATHWVWADPGSAIIPNPGRQIARLTQVIPGYVITKSFDGITADYVMFFLYYSTAVLFFHRSVRLLINDKVALFAVIIFAVHPLIIANYSVTFASPAITYSIVSLYLIARSLVPGSRIRKLGLLCGSGVAMGAALHAYLGIIAFGVANYLIYFFFELFYTTERLGQRLWSVLQASMVVLAGMAGFTLALGGVAMLFGADFSLVLTQFLFIEQANRNSAELFYKPEWYLHGGVAGLLLTGLLLCGINVCVITFGRRKVAFSEELRRRILAVSLAVLCLAVALLAYNELGGVFLQYDYYYVFFTPYLCVVLFCPLLLLSTGNSVATLGWASIFLLCCLGVVAIDDDLLGWLHQPPIEAAVSMAAAVAAGLVYAVIVFFRWSGRRAAALLMAVVIVMLAVVRPEQMGAQIWKSPRSLEYARQYGRVREGLTLLNQVRFHGYPDFWVATDDGPSELIAYPRSYLSCSFEHPFPEVDPRIWSNMNRRFIVGEEVVVVSQAPNLRLTAAAAFAALGYAVNEAADFSINSSGERYEFLVEHVSGRIAATEQYQWLVDGKPPPDAEQIENPFDVSVVSESNKQRQDSLPVKVTTAPEPWVTGAQFPPRTEDLQGPLWIRIRANVHGGPIGIGVLNRDGTQFLTRTSLTASGDTTVTLSVSKLERIGDIVVQNWDKAQSADVRIDAITVLKPTQATIEAVYGKIPAFSSSDIPADAKEFDDAFGPPVRPESKGQVQEMLPVEITTPAAAWAYGAQFPLLRELKGPVWVRVRASVQHGRIGIGVLNREGSDFLSRTSVAATKDTTITLRVWKPQEIGDLVIQSWNKGESADVKIIAIKVLAPSSAVEGPSSKIRAPSSPGTPSDAEEVKNAFGLPVSPGSKSKLQEAFPAGVSTPAVAWGYGAQFPLQIQDLKGPLWIRVRASVQRGAVGIGVLNREGSDFLARTSVPAGSGDNTITLQVSKPEQIGDLVIQTWDQGKPSEVRIDDITVIKPNSPTAEHH